MAYAARLRACADALRVAWAMEHHLADGRRGHEQRRRGTLDAACFTPARTPHPTRSGWRRGSRRMRP
ncbi:hypothetical protein, partial [Adonisia turfae]